MRLFVAVSPPVEVVEMLRGIDRPEDQRVRWTTEPQWHVTLRFLGEVGDPGPVSDALRLVPAALAAVAVTEVRAVLGPRVGWFSGRQVLQVPVSGLDALAAAVADVTDRWGRASDDHPFSGHLTLARARGRTRGPARFAGSPLDAAWRVESCGLVSSTLGRQGSHYETLATVALADTTTAEGEHR